MARTARKLRPFQPQATPQSESTPAPQRLWLHLHLPMLAVSAASAPQKTSQPGNERAALERLAQWAQRYTSMVTIEKAGLTLEVGASLLLFGGLSRLREAILDGVRAQGYAPQAAVAPTPIAARWLAQAGREVAILEMSALPGVLGGLPLQTLGWAPAIEKKLLQMGVRTLRDVLRLPRDGLARRFGPQLPLLLDRALGLQADPRNAYAAPAVFQSVLELPAEAERSDALLPGLDILLEELETFLIARAAGIQSLELSLHHGARPATRVPLTLRQPVRHAIEFAELFVHRLESVALPAPVTSLALHSEPLRAWQVQTTELLEQRTAGRLHEDLQTLVQRLQARLGTDAVYGLETVADHRPERAARRRAALYGHAGALPGKPRPLRLLGEAQRLEGQSAVARAVVAVPADIESAPAPANPRAYATIPTGYTLLAGPERLVSGWWDGARIARDYYQALDPHGRRVWIFLQLMTSDDSAEWFLHGWFA